MSVEEVRDEAFYMDQAALDNPPAAPSKYMFIVPAIAHVGRSRIPDWNDAERTSLVGGEAAARSGIEAIQSAAGLLHQAMMDGEITGYRRKQSGGALEAMDPSAWINEYTSDALPLSSGGPAIHGSVYLFVDRSELLKAFPSATSIAVPAFDEASLSDYMRLALHVAAQGFGPAFTGEKKEIVRALFEHAPAFGLGDGVLSDPIANQIATILRNRDAQGGRGGVLDAARKGAISV